MMGVPGREPDEPFPASFLTVDGQHVGRLSNPEQLAVRAWYWSLVRDAFERAGLLQAAFAVEDRGDGLVTVFDGTVARPRIERVVYSLVEDVAAGPSPVPLRIAVHAGEVHRDPDGFSGADLNHVFRLVDAPLLKEALEGSRARCAVLVSDDFHRSTVRHHYAGPPPHTFQPVGLTTKEGRAQAWLALPGDDKRCARIAAANPPSTPQGAEPARHIGVSIKSGRDVTISGSTIAAGDVLTGIRRSPGGRRHSR